MEQYRTTGNRQSGRTTRFINAIPHTRENIYIVSASSEISNHIKDVLYKERGFDESKIKCVNLNNLYMIIGVNPDNIYFEHTAYEFSSLEQLKYIHHIEDSRDKVWNVK